MSKLQASVKRRPKNLKRVSKSETEQFPKKRSKAKASPPTTDANGVPTLINTFAEPAKDQSSSPLLSLAAELRLKVLRNLLKSSTVIRNERDFWPPDVADSDFDEQRRLTSQILACCQQLCAEGRYVLYKENKISLRVTSRYFSMLDVHLYMPNKSMKLYSGHEDILFMARRHKSLGPLLKVYAVLSTFASVSVDFQPGTHEDLYTLCRLLRNLLKGKCVEVKFSSHTRGEDKRLVRDWLQACRILRCKEFKFVDFVGRDVGDLCSTITGKSKVIDHFKIVKGCKELVRSSRIHQYHGESSARFASSELIKAGMNYEAVELTNSKPKFSSSADNMIEGILSPRRKVIKRKIQVLEAEQKRLDACEAAMRSTLSEVEELE